MTGSHLLDAIGLLDDDLIQEAEAYRRPKRNYRPWLGLAACLAVVLTLRWGLSHIGMGGGSAGPSTPMNSTPAASTPAGGSDSPEGEEPSAEDTAPAIMVDGVLYFSTGEPVPGEPDPSVIHTVTSYTSGAPEMDGQTNFSQDLSARYAVTDLGVVVLMEEEWILFEP